jgi:type IV pilus assembly protein PilE
MQTTNPSDLSTGHKACNPPQRRLWSAGHGCERGFTLIEVMIVVAIVAILATIALPSYQQSVRKSRRADAMLLLQQVQIAQEQFRAECTRYAMVFGAERSCHPTDPMLHRVAVASTSPDGYYTLGLSSVTATGFTATATAVPGKSQADDTGCTAIRLTVSGLSMTKEPATCWSQ